MSCHNLYVHIYRYTHIRSINITVLLTQSSEKKRSAYLTNFSFLFYAKGPRPPKPLHDLQIRRVQHATYFLASRCLHILQAEYEPSRVHFLEDQRWQKILKFCICHLMQHLIKYNFYYYLFHYCSKRGFQPIMFKMSGLLFL